MVLYRQRFRDMTFAHLFQLLPCLCRARAISHEHLVCVIDLDYMTRSILGYDLDSCRRKNGRGAGRRGSIVGLFDDGSGAWTRSWARWLSHFTRLGAGVYAWEICEPRKVICISCDLHVQSSTCGLRTRLWGGLWRLVKLMI